MKTFSTKNTYATNGEGELRLTRSQIEARIRKAKKKKLYNQELEHGYNFCKLCKANSSVRLDCSHVVPVKECLETGRAELAYDVKNIDVLCRSCHQKRDKLY